MKAYLQNKLKKIYKSMKLNETLLSYLGCINTNDLINILEIILKIMNLN